MAEKCLDFVDHAELGDGELLARALGCSVTHAVGLLDRTGGIDGLVRAGPRSWTSLAGVGPARAGSTRAAMELGRRLGRRVRRSAVHDPDEAARWCRPHLRGLEDEVLLGLYLDRRHGVLGLRTLTRGSPDHTIVDPRQILREGLRMGASALILAHNHPSGHPEPSVMDLEATSRVQRAAREVGLHLVDHLVFGGDRYTSMAGRGDLPCTYSRPAMMLAQPARDAEARLGR